MQPFKPENFPFLLSSPIQVGLEKVATEDTRLIYMTTGVLLQKVVSAKSLVAFTHIFIDEVRALPRCALLRHGSRSQCGGLMPVRRAAGQPGARSSGVGWELPWGG